MLERWHYIALAIPAILLVGEWRRGLENTRIVTLLSLACCSARRRPSPTRDPAHPRFLDRSRERPARGERRAAAVRHAPRRLDVIMLVQIATAMGAAWPARTRDEDGGRDFLSGGAPAPPDAVPGDDNLPT